MRKSPHCLLLLCLLSASQLLHAQITCSPSGNLWVYTNYDGGVLNIDVDVNMPNIKIGICTYEPTTINITGAFAGNVTEVRYAGYVSTTNNHCPNSPSTTTITGVPAPITSVNFLPPSTLSNPNGNSSIVCAYSCSTTSSQGGCNTADQIKDYFQTTMNGTLVSYFTQYGCWSTSPYTLSSGGNCCNSVLPCNVSANAGNSVTICPNGSTQLNGSGTGGATVFSWTPTTGLSNPNIANPTASPTATTTYTLTASDGALCGATDTVTVTVANPQASIAPIAGVCAGTPAFTLNTGSPAGGTWSGAFVSGGMFNPSSAGSHSVTYTITDANNCTASATASIEVFASPVAVFQPAGPFCLGDPSFFLAGGSPAGGTYAGPGVASGEFFPNLAGAGNHQLQYAYTDSNGCSDTAVQTFTVHPVPVTPTVSLGGVDSLYASTPGDSFTWSLNGLPWLTNGPIVQAPQSGNYSVVVWVNGCPSASSAVFQLELQSIDLGGTLLEVWPNPASTTLRLRAVGLSFNASLLDLQGRAVLPTQAVDGQGSLDLSNLAAGAYLLRVECGPVSGMLRVLKQ